MEGARLKRARLDDTPAEDAARVQRLASLTGGPFLESLRGGGDPSQTPVFALDMPRSGTTLTEQIIARHPAVQDAGNLPDLIHILHVAVGRAAGQAVSGKAGAPDAGVRHGDGCKICAPTARACA